LERMNRNRHVMAMMLVMIMLFGVTLQFDTFFEVLADWGMIPVIPDVSVYEPGQKAIIAWNGREEILILTADVTSTVNSTVLQILPLPSNPMKIEKASLESFYVVEELIWFHAPPPPPWGYWGNETEEVRVIFHEKIGMHDITVVEAHNVLEFAEWMDQFLLQNGISEQVALEDFEWIIGDYILRDFNFYVLDLIEVSSNQRSVEPIMYKFDTHFLYYPLLITSSIGGDGKIILFLLTKNILQGGYHPLAKAQYHGSISKPIQFEVSNEELSLIDPSIGELFEDKACLTALIYEGPLGKLIEDMVIMRLTGDLNFDSRVDMHDIATVAQAFGSLLGHARWNRIADINEDNKVDMKDVGIVCTQFGKELEYAESVAGVNDILELQMTVERSYIDIGDSVNITLTLRNVGNKTLMVWFGSSQSFDLYLYYMGVPIAKWSDGMAFLMLVWELYLEPNETYTRTLNWDFYIYDSSTGNRYPPIPGIYEIVGVCVGHFLETSPAVVTSKLSIEFS